MNNFRNDLVKLLIHRERMEVIYKSERDAQL